MFLEGVFKMPILLYSTSKYRTLNNQCRTVQVYEIELPEKDLQIITLVTLLFVIAVNLNSKLVVSPQYCACV